MKRPASPTYRGPSYEWLSKCDICCRARSAGSHAKCSKERKVAHLRARQGEQQ
jgi:hypothetical protein